MSYLGTKPGHQVVTTQQIVDGAVTTSKIVDANVTTAKVADAAITQAKLAANVAGNGPTFSAYANANTTISSGYSYTLVALQIEEFDVGSCFNNTNSSVTLNGLTVPAYSFCPNVAGYYQINGAFTLTQVKSALIQIYKNGAAYKQGVSAINSAAANEYGTSTNVSVIVYLNGTGDYVQLRANTPSASAVYGSSDLSLTYFQGALVRAS